MILDDIIATIKNIIKQRIPKDECHKDTDVGSTNAPLKTVDSLPTPMIGEISSFLQQRDYIQFSKCSRDCYIGSNSPNTLRELDFLYVDDYSAVNLSKFVNLQKLRLVLSECRYLSSSDAPVCRNLTKICLDNSDQVDVDPGILDALLIPLENITHLRLSRFGLGGNTEHYFNPTTFLQIISRFPNMKYLWLWDVYFPAFDEFQQLRLHLFSKLQVFGTNGVKKQSRNQILSICSNTLRALSPWGTNVRFANDVSFLNLEEIQFQASCRYMDGRMIYNKMSKLKRIRMCCDKQSLMPSSVDGTKQMIMELLSKQKHLEQFAIEAPVSALGTICAAIDRGIYDHVGQ